MTGLVGIFKAKDDHININDLLPKMYNVVKHKKWYKTQIFNNQKVGLGRVTLGISNPEVQPIYNEDRSLCIMMEGEVFDYQIQKEELKSKGHKFIINNDPEFVLHLFEEFGTNFVHKLNGSFLIIIYDIKKHELFFINDRFGTKPLYYSICNDNLIFGSEVKAILENKNFVRVVDDKAVLDFFTFGYIIGNKTLFKDINLLPYASMLSCSKNGISIENYWDLEFKEDYKDYPDEYYINKLSSLLIQAVKRQINTEHRLEAALSGGLDSRTIVGIIDKIEPNLQIPFFTIGFDKNCEDVRIARLIAKKLKKPHHCFHLAPDYIADYGEKGVYLTDGMLGLTFLHVISTLKNIKKHFDIFFLGTLGGSLLHNKNFDTLYNSSLNQTFDYKLFAYLIGVGLQEEDIKDIFLESYFKKNENLIKESFQEIQNRKLPNNLLNKCSYYAIIQRDRRFIFDAINLSRQETEVRMPFLDNDLIDFHL